MITQGEWKVDNETIVSPIIDIADMLSNNPDDAHFIAAAGNACQKVNPNNPQAVAESIGDMYEALKKICLEHSHWVFEELAEALGNTNTRILKDAIEVGNKALAKAEGK